MASAAKTFPGEWRKASTGYRYFLPASLFLSQNLAFPVGLLGQLEKTGIAHGRFSSLTDRLPKPQHFIYACTRHNWSEVHAYIRALEQATDQHRRNYYDALDRGRQSEEGAILWISFFLDAVRQTADNGIAVTQSLMDYHSQLSQNTIPKLGRRAKNGLKSLDHLYTNLIVNARTLQEKLHFSAQVSDVMLAQFVELGILEEITGNKRNRLFAFKTYLDMLEGTAE